MSITKKEAQRIHAKRRFKERYNLVFNRHVRRDFLSSISEGIAKLVLKQSNRVFVYDVRYRGDTYRVVYDKNRHEIITALFPDDNPNLFCGNLNSVGPLERAFLRLTEVN